MKKNLKAFTIVELMVVVGVIAVLAVVGVMGFEGVQEDARNAQRSSRLNTVAEALEKYYNKNGEYPTCAAMTASSNTIVTTTLIGLDPDTLTAPTATKGTNSFTCTDPTSDTYAYIGGGAEFTLKYKEDGSGSLITMDSRHRFVAVNYNLSVVAGTGGSVSGGGTFASGSSQTITATPSGNYTFSSWSGSTGCAGAASHSITMDGNKTCSANFAPIMYTLSLSACDQDGDYNCVSDSGWGTVSGGGSYAPGSTPTITASPKPYPFGFDQWQGDSGCDGAASHTILMDGNKDCRAYFWVN